MAMRLRGILPEPVITRLFDAVMIVLVKKLVEYLMKAEPVYKLLVRGAKIWSKLIVYAIISVLSIAFRSRFEVLKYFDVAIILAINELIDILVDRKPFAIAMGTDKIEAYNLDKNTNVEIWVNNGKISFTTPPKTDSNGNVSITLPTAMPEGTNKLLVHSGFRAWYGEVIA